MRSVGSTPDLDIYVYRQCENGHELHRLNVKQQAKRELKIHIFFSLMRANNRNNTPCSRVSGQERTQNRKKRTQIDLQHGNFADWITTGTATATATATATVIKTTCKLLQHRLYTIEWFNRSYFLFWCLWCEKYSIKCRDFHSSFSSSCRRRCC